MAKTGTRFNNFHVTAVCAPTRACLFTGINAHSVGVGNIAEWAQQGQPGYKGWIRQDAATMAEVLRAQAYDVLPLEDDTLKLYRASVPRPRATYVFFPGMTRLDRLSAPNTYNYNSVIAIQMVLNNNRANGVILASGDSISGYELFLQNGYLHIVYAYTRDTIYTFKSGRKLAQGEHKLRIEINKTGSDSAIANVSIVDQSFGIMESPKFCPIYTPNQELGVVKTAMRQLVVPINPPPFIFDQKLKRVIVDVDIRERCISTGC
jgi:hypothetical protein